MADRTARRYRPPASLSRAPRDRGRRGRRAARAPRVPGGSRPDGRGQAPEVRLAVGRRRERGPRTVADRRPAPSRRATRAGGVVAARRATRPDGDRVRRARRAAMADHERTTTLADLEQSVGDHGVDGAPAVPRGHRPVRAERLAERFEVAGRGHARATRTATSSPCARRGRRSATRPSGTSWNIKNISAVHRPMPFTSVSSRTTSSSGKTPNACEAHLPRVHSLGEVADRRRLRARQPRAAQRVVADSQHRVGRGHAVEQRLEPTVNRARGPAGELLVADHPRQLGEVRPTFATPRNVARPDIGDERSHRRVTTGQIVRRLEVRIHAGTLPTRQAGGTRDKVRPCTSD